MRFDIRTMVGADAAEVASWHYEDEYAFYDFEADADDLAELLDPGGWGDSYYATDGDDGTLAGFFEFVREANVVDVGLGLHPRLVGRGLGSAYLDAGLQFAAERFGPELFTLEVAAFNRRALVVYQRAGFVEVERFDHRTNGGLHPFVRMSRRA
jgi:ribosomal-protein-alanine N-acetyltransferase